MRYCKYFYFDYQIIFDSPRIQSEFYINFMYRTVERALVQESRIKSTLFSVEIGNPGLY